MPDIDCHSEMTNFHREEVTLGRKEQTAMRDRRNSGRTRLENGLNTAKHPQPTVVCSQGSYQMRTMVQDAANDYDIDDGAYFGTDDLKDSAGNALTPKAARQRICDALAWDGRLKHEATVMRNCVRQVYAEGHHIDVPVYRIVKTKDKDGKGSEHFELASGDEWVRSDARAVTKWFNDLVGELNAGESDGSQMRRLTKLTKKFARRADWKDKTTSGISISKLVVDHFQDFDTTDRDDLALRKLWQAIDKRLKESTEIEHPVVTTMLAQNGDAKVGFFRDSLSDALETLKALDATDCARKKALETWDSVFDTNYFSKQPEPAAKAAAVHVTSAESARRNDGGGRFG